MYTRCLLFFVRVPGLEPGTSSLSVTRSNHLSYARKNQSAEAVSQIYQRIRPSAMTPPLTDVPELTFMKNTILSERTHTKGGVS